MAKFESNGEIEIVITPQEFIQNCSASELIRLKGLITDAFDLVDSDYVPEESDFAPPPRSFDQIKLNQALGTIEDAWLSLTKTDENIIKDIAKKYHTV